MSRTNDQNVFTELNIYTAAGIHFGGMLWKTSSVDGDVVRLGAQHYSKALITQSGLGDITIRLPDARIYPLGFTDMRVRLSTTSSGSVRVEDADQSLVGFIPANGAGFFVLKENATKGGAWELLTRS